MNLQSIAKKEVKNFILIGILIIFLTFQLSNFILKGIFESFYALIILALLYIFIRSQWELFVLLFIIAFPLRDLLPQEAVLIPGINLREILSILLVMSYLFRYRKINFDLEENQKLAIVLAFFFLIIFTNTFHLKNYLIWGQYYVSELKLIIRLLKNVIYFLCIALIISKATNFKIYKNIHNGIIFGLILISISVFFSSFFAKLGLQVFLEKDINFLEGNLMKARAVGVFGGDSGFFAHYLSVGFGYFLSLFEKERKSIFLLGLGIIFSSVLVTASRGGFFTISIILLLFILKNVHRNKYLLIILLIVLVVLFFIFGDYLIDRMQELEIIVESGNVNDINRVKYQSFYLREMMQKPYIFITGMLRKSKLGFWRVPHNQYLGMIFVGGLSYLLYFLILLYKIFKVNRIYPKPKYSFSIIYPFVGFIIPYFISPNMLVIYFPLILAVSKGITNEK